MIEVKDQVIICASKYFTAKEIVKINKLGINDFGENRVEDLLNKKLELTNLNINWHFIGHLQTNKIKKLINEIDYLHSLESLKQADLINKYRINPLKCFIQLNISLEDNKKGITLDNLDEFIQQLKKYDKIDVVGFMTMGVLNDDFKTNQVFEKASKLANTYNYPFLSMGMSNDYLIAIENKATHLRIGSYFKKIIGG